MAGAGLLLLVASLVGLRPLQLLRSEGTALPKEVRIEWVSADYRSFGTATLPVDGGGISVGSPPPGAEAVRIVGPNVISLPVRWKDRPAGIRVETASSLRLSAISPEVKRLRLFMQLKGSDLEYWREIETLGKPEVEVAVPLGEYAVAIDLGHERAPIVIPSLVITRGSLAHAELKEVAGKALTFGVVAKENGKPLAGAAIAGQPTAGLPAVFWRALGARCGVSDARGVLSCGVVPATLPAIDVRAPKRRYRRVTLPPAQAKDATDAPPPQTVSLATYQTVAIQPSISADDPAELLAGMKAFLLRCDRPPCDESTAARKALEGQPGVSFANVEPGIYRVWLEGSKARTSSTSVTVSASSDAPDTVDTVLELLVWHVFGSTKLADGVGVPARLSFELLREDTTRGELGGVIDTDADGAYELVLLAPAGSYLSARAVSEKPVAEGEIVPGVKLQEGNDRVPLDVELSTTGAVVKLTDGETGEAVPDCDVVFYHWGSKYGGVRILKSDADGVVRRLGITGTFLARAMCDGYRPVSTEKTELSEAGSEITLKLQPAGGIRLRVLDDRGNRLVGATVFLEQTAFENVANPFQAPAEPVGTTGLEGELPIPPRARPGFYVLAPGYALHVGRLAPCAVKTGCIEDVRLTRPLAFPGIRVRSIEGEPVSAGRLVFSKDGVPIPVSIQTELLRVNQAAPQQLIVLEGVDTVHMLPGLFGPGMYDVEYLKQQQGSSLTRIPLARIALPATNRIELTLPMLTSLK